MDRHSYTRLAEIVARVLEAADQEREARLRRLCGEDEDLFHAASRLLAFAEPEEGAFSDAALGRQRAQLDELIDSVELENAGADEGTGAEAQGGPAAHSAQAEGWLPSRIAGYEILRTIGRGGTGVVFEARQESPSRSVAIKLLHPAFATKETILRLRREAEVLGRLRHVGIAQIFEAGVFDAGAGEQPFLAIELIDGSDLLTYAQGAQLGTRDRIELLAKVVDAVAHAHQRGVIHRDLKPDNILVEAETGQPKLLDFGIAGIDEVSSSLRATTDGQLLGTVGYMAPEQARRSLGSVGTGTDVYALCAIAYELLLHRPLRQVEGLSITQALSEVAGREAPRRRGVGAGIPRDLATVIEKGLEQAPEDRYTAAQDLGADLRRWLEDRPIVARPASRVDRALKFIKRNPVLISGVAATTLALTAGLLATMHQARLARSAEARSRQDLYAAEMVLATGHLSDPATSQQLERFVEPWRPRPALEAEGISPDFEWHLIDSVRRRNAIELPIEGSPLPIAWSPDGERIAVGTSDAIAVHSGATGAELAFLVPADAPGDTLLTCLQWSKTTPNRLYFSGVSAMGAWDVDEESLRWMKDVPFSSAITSLPDGSVMVLREDDTLHRLEGDTGEPLSTVPGAWHQASTLEYHAPSARLIAPSRDWTSTLLDLETLAPVPSDATPYGTATAFAWHPNGRQMLTSYHSGLLRVFHVDPWEPAFTIQEHRETAHHVDWSPDGKLLASASSDRTVRLHDAESGELLGSFVGHRRPVRQVRFRPGTHDDGVRKLASVGSSGKVILWDVDEPDAVRVRHPEDFGPFDLGARLRWKPRTERLIAWDRDSFLRVDFASAEEHSLEKWLGRAYESSDGRWRFVVGKQGVHEVREAQGRAAVKWTSPGSDPFIRGAWHPDRPVFVAALASGIYRLELDETGQLDQVAAGVPERISALEMQVTDVRWNDAGTEVAIATTAGRALVVAVPSGEWLLDYRLPTPTGSNCITWSPDGASVAIGCSDGAVRIVGAGAGQTERLETVLRGHAFEIEGIDWHPNGRRIATASRDRTVKLWDPATGHLVASLECESRLTGVAWVQNGTALVAVDIDGRVYTYDASRSLDSMGTARGATGK